VKKEKLAEQKSHTLIFQMAEQTIPKMLPKMFHKYVGQGSVFPSLKGYVAGNPRLEALNSIYNMAPMAKWSLSIVPMYGVITGTPSVDRVDFNTSVSLACTGFVWSVYAMMITPQNAGSRALAAVNFCMGSVNSYNAYRRYNYDQSLLASKKA
jgi:hypothetical protein